MRRNNAKFSTDAGVAGTHNKLVRIKAVVRLVEQLRIDTVL
jgi:hypothetical protein